MSFRHFPHLVALCAAISFACLSGCSEQSSTTTVSESHEDDHDHDHGDHDHGDHDHGDHDHGDHDHGDHEDHDHGDHEGHDHDEHSHNFDSLGEAVAEIVSLRDKIRDGFKNDDVDSAHGPLHHIGEVLTAAEDMIEKSDFSDEKKAEVAGAIDALFDGFGDVDAGLHGDSGKKYDEVSESIDTAITTLEKYSE